MTIPSLISIDPGNTHSALVRFIDGKPTWFCDTDNAEIEALLEWVPSDHLAIEMVACYGMAVGEEVFETVFHIGRFTKAFSRPYTKVYRKDVKMHFCHSMRAKDSNIRQAILDRYGGKDAAIGKKKTPGPLYGISGDVWSALAVGLYWTDLYRAELV